MFLEQNYQNETTDPAPFTLKENDHKGKLSMHRLFVEIADPSEYLFAKSVLGSWGHWEYLKKSPFFKPYYQAMRDEMEAKLMAEGILTIREDAQQNPVSARWLAEKGWEPKATKGRPSKAEVDRERKQAAQALNELDEDAARIFGNGD